jgi:pilus assembly protein CpaC
MRVLDLNRGAIDKLGINYGGLEYKPDGSVGFVNQPFWVKLERGVDNIFDFAAHVDAMVQNNQAKVLSEPNLLVDDGGEASMLVGGEIPVPVAAAGSGGVASVTVQWRPYGVSMNMTATILDDGKQINLKLSPEVSTLDYGNAVTLGGFVVPALKTRKAQTLVTVDNGRSLVLGGMLQSTEATNVNRIPLLGSLPIIGELFRHKDFQEGKSELVIIVTPEIVTDQAAVTAPPEPTQP